MRIITNHYHKIYLLNNYKISINILLLVRKFYLIEITTYNITTKFIILFNN